MKLRVLMGAALASALAFAPGTAHAKGVAGADVSGPGLDEPLDFGEGDGGRSAQVLVEASGFYEIIFEGAPGGEAGRPAGDLGPRYTATYHYLVDADETVPLRQDLYPFASKGPVTYTPPGQQLVGSERAQGGWSRARAELRTVLVSAGVPRPESRPDESRSAERGLTVALGAGGVVIALAVAAAIAAVRRRRPTLASAE